MSIAVEIREARVPEYRQVAQMHYRAWRQSYQGIIAAVLLDLFDDPLHWAYNVYPEKLSQPGWTMWLAESAGQLVGVSIYGPEPDRPDRLEIDALYVVPEHQGQRVGSLLMADALTAHSSGDVVLWCAEQNHRARRFYEAKGFELDGRRWDWKPIPGLAVPQVGYIFKRSVSKA
ncbi:MAG TPA: GNAT family N-acetyltransferase [Mycobacterium sp.]|jgi:GNAT superfamily N-acetyltransferase|nr:GNAT family N-acetyltransferase [Mycobacterium sp.]